MQELTKEVSIEQVLDNADNVAEIMDDLDLTMLGKFVCEGYEADRASRDLWEEKNDKAMELALQVVEEKTTPWQGSSNVKYPLLTTAALQFSSRAYPALISSSNIVKGRVIGFDVDGEKLERSIRIGKHMSYQLIEQMEDWEEEMDKLCLTLPILGCVFKKTYFDPVLGTNTSEVIYPRDLVINYYSPTIEKAPRITHVLELSENDVYERVANGLYRDVELSKGDGGDDEDSAEENRGLTPPQGDDDTEPYNILEQHCLIDLDGDGYKEPYIVTVHEEMQEVLRIVPRFDEDAISANREGEIIRIEATQFFTKFGFIPSPDGSIYDLGFGTLLSPINDTVNTLLNQLIDAGTMSNLQAGFVSKGIRIRGGNQRFEPGEWKQVNSMGDDLRKGIYPLPTREPSAVLFKLLDTMVNAGERLSSVTEMMTGEIPGQNTKATVAMAAIEQGMKVFSAIYKRMYRSLKKEFRKLYALNREHLSLEEYFTILDVGKEQGAQISVIDYRMDDTDVIPYADPTVASEAQRLARVEALGQVLQLGTINPQEYTRRYLEATEQPNIEALMEVQPKQPEMKDQIDLARMKDESARGWRDLAIKAALAGSAISKEEVDSIVALSNAKTLEAKQAVDAIQAEAKSELEEKKVDESSSGADKD